MKYKEEDLTEWFDGSKFVPCHVGEYQASVSKWPDILRWWNGEHWSEPYNRTNTNSEKNFFRKNKEIENANIHFRGLKVKP